MTYNLSLINGTGVVPFIQTVNSELMFNWYGNLALITMFVLFYMGFVAYTNNTKKSLGMSSLFVALFSIIFRTMGLVQDVVVLIAWIIVAIVAGLAFLTPDD